MTYLELVNNVLTRLREPMIASVDKSQDAVVNIVKNLANDAKRHVEMAHSWNATRMVWEMTSEKGRPSYILESTSGGCRVSKVSVNGNHIHQWDLQTLLHETNNTGTPHRYAFDGTDNEGNVSIRLDPMPEGGEVICVLGHRVLPDLKTDDDEVRLPSQPVLYYALALAARERGEVGGQTAQELFSMASQFISDAIALDANLSPTEKIWAVV
tara:strand:+ start:179 stop:814 length:636 start_codon:yes stop_codon:yes gene_type:complete